MFRIEFFVDDKNLGEAFKRLAGLARNVSHAYVPNAKPKGNGHIKMTSSESVDLVMKEVRHRKVKELTADVARSVVGDLGFNPTSYSYFIQQAIKAGQLKKGPKKGNGMIYFVQGEK